jgi:hypothetical protein
MKYSLRAVFLLVAVSLVVAAFAIVSGRFIRPSCTTGVAIIEGPHGEKIECVCVGGVHATCFEPGS